MRAVDALSIYKIVKVITSFGHVPVAAADLNPCSCQEACCLALHDIIDGSQLQTRSGVGPDGNLAGWHIGGVN